MSNDDKPGNGHDGETPTEVATEPQATLPNLEEKIQRAEQERQEAHERLLRVAADFENYKKRVKRETDDATARVKEQLLREILPVLDNFERALQAVARG